MLDPMDIYIQFVDCLHIWYYHLLLLVRQAFEDLN